MSVINFPVTTDLDHVAQLLDRLDPDSAECTVPGCVHIHGNHGELPVAA
ncbi:MAG: hypothetical protein U0Y82_15240 [Thermoleophilia bacterium]